MAWGVCLESISVLVVASRDSVAIRKKAPQFEHMKNFAEAPKGPSSPSDGNTDAIYFLVLLNWLSWARIGVVGDCRLAVAPRW